MKILRQPLSLLLVLAVLAHLGSAMHPSRVSVHIPADLHKPEGDEHVHAHFGFGWGNYKGSISAYVYLVDTPNQFCTSIDFSHNETMGYPTQYGPDTGTPFIIMTNASEWCSPVTQTRHAQSLGAAAVLLAYDGCPCGEHTNCTAAADSRHCVSDSYMVNDGSGGDVTIPTFLLYKSTSDALTDRMKTKKQKVLMELTWGLPITEKEIETEDPSYKLHLWSSARDPLLSLETYQELRTITKVFGTAAPFEPRLTVLNGTLFGCNEGTDINVTVGPCKELCTNHGRYCALSSGSLKGQVIVKETVRRLCIWEHFGKDDPEQYWEYMLHHTESCQEPPHLYDDEECIVKSYKKAKIHDHTIITECMKDTGELDKDDQNTMLQDALNHQKNSGVVQLPLVSLGNFHHISDVTSSFFIVEAICKHFWSRANVANVPEICYKCAACPNIMGCLEHGHCVDFKPDKHHHHHTDAGTGGKTKKKKKHRGRNWFLFLSLVGVVGLGGFLYKKRQEQMDGVGGGGVGMLNGYFRVDGGGGEVS